MFYVIIVEYLINFILKILNWFIKIGIKNYYKYMLVFFVCDYLFNCIDFV